MIYKNIRTRPMKYMKSQRRLQCSVTKCRSTMLFNDMAKLPNYLIYKQPSLNEYQTIPLHALLF